MKKIFLLTMLFTSALLWSGEADSIRLGKIKIGIVFSPDYCYRFLNYRSSEKWIQDLRNEEEVATFGYTTGLGIKIELSNKILLETGVYYSIMGEQTKTTELFWVNSSPDFPAKSKTQYQFKYINIPLKLHYVFGSKKVSYFVSAGFSINIFTEKKTKVILEFKNGHKTSDNSVVDLGYLKFNLATVIGFGIKYDVTKKISISIEPVYRQFINSIVVGTGTKEYPYSLGANIGVYYTFGRKR